MNIRERVSDLMRRRPDNSDANYLQRRMESNNHELLKLGVMNGLTVLYTYINYGDSGACNVNTNDDCNKVSKAKTVVDNFTRSAHLPGQNFEILFDESRENLLGFLTDKADRRGVDLVALKRSILVWEKELSTSKTYIVQDYGSKMIRKLQAAVKVYEDSQK